MKFLVLLISFIVLINFTYGNDGFVQITPMGNGDSCATTPYGQGYLLPTGTEIQVDDECYQFSFTNSSSHLQVSYLGKNCTLEHPENVFYEVGQCVDFKLENSPFSFASIISQPSGDHSLPVDAIVYEYYYFSYYCSGPSYKIFYTNGYSNQFSKYECVNGKPEIFECNDSDSCSPIESKGCTNDKVPLPYRIDC